MIKLRTLGFIDNFSTAQLYLASYFYVIFKLFSLKTIILKCDQYLPVNI